MYACAMFSVIYRWKLHPGMESDFASAWRAATIAIRDKYNTRGSRLHLADDGTYYAYAVWPSRSAWEEAQWAGAVLKEAADKMRACTLERLETVPLDVVEDMLQP